MDIDPDHMWHMRIFSIVFPTINFMMLSRLCTGRCGKFSAQTLKLQLQSFAKIGLTLLFPAIALLLKDLHSFRNLG
eukprot:1003394-Amorphochlora_amoeboformis.AAC.1